MVGRGASKSWGLPRLGFANHENAAVSRIPFGSSNLKFWQVVRRVLPITKILLRQRESIVSRNVAADHQDGIVGTIVRRMNPSDVVTFYPGQRLRRTGQRMTIRRVAINNSRGDETSDGSRGRQRCSQTI